MFLSICFLPMFKYIIIKDSDVPGVVARSMLVRIDICFLVRHYNKEKEKSKDCSFCLLSSLWHACFFLLWC